MVQFLLSTVLSVFENWIADHHTILSGVINSWAYFNKRQKNSAGSALDEAVVWRNKFGWKKIMLGCNNVSDFHAGIERSHGLLSITLARL